MISVIVVTHNRIESLKSCIESILSQTAKNEHEIIVIDNASGDNTFESLKKEYKGSLKLIKNDTKKSLQYCKRIGLEKSSGEIIAFTDDDCIPYEKWLSSILKCFNNFDCDISGGPVKPLNKLNLPWWWQNSMNWTIGIADITFPSFLPLGCNIAFRRNVLKDIELVDYYNSYDPDIVYSEDTLRIKNALKKGYKLTIDNTMVVYHDISPNKLSFKYIIQRSWLEGNHWAKNQKDLNILLIRVIALLINPFRFIVTLNIHYLLRTVVSLAYIITFFKKNAYRN